MHHLSTLLITKIFCLFRCLDWLELLGWLLQQPLQPIQPAPSECSGRGAFKLLVHQNGWAAAAERLG